MIEPWLYEMRNALLSIGNAGSAGDHGLEEYATAEVQRATAAIAALLTEVPEELANDPMWTEMRQNPPHGGTWNTWLDRLPRKDG